jgi:DNA processing protein
MSRSHRLRLAFCGLHPLRTVRLVAEFGSAEAVLDAIARGQVEVPEAARKAACREAGWCRRCLDEIGVAPLWRGDPGYPGHLHGLWDAPDVLFVRGLLPLVPGVAIVGTRRCTRYGRDLAHAYGRACAEAGWPVVSGLARGIDGQVHRGVVAAEGVGVGVLGSGPDVVYPADHRDLFVDLVAGGGAIVTEYPPGAPPEGWRFPPRNRIISGLAAAVVVVEAAETGGALITAGLALEQGRAVFAVPGDVGRETSRGCNLLVRDGAVPVLDPDDLVEALSLVPGLCLPRSRQTRRVASCSNEVLARIGPSGVSLEELVVLLGATAGEVLAQVACLELDGAVCRRDGMIFRS